MEPKKRTDLECPQCGCKELYWSENTMKPDKEIPPKPWPAGFDPYCDWEYHGAWVCSKCGKAVSS